VRLEAQFWSCLAVFYGSGTGPFQENRSTSFSTYVKKINLKPNLNRWRHDCCDELGTTDYQAQKGISPDAKSASVSAILRTCRGCCSEFMPYTKESRVLPEDAQICYMVLTPPLVGSLDYTIRVHEELVKDPDGGTSYHSRWELANTDGPAPRPGITRVTINEGSWLLESIGNQTRATYTLYTDGGCIPPLLMNFANKQSVSRLFDALHARMRDGE
jgi:hypothetical protein